MKKISLSALVITSIVLTSISAQAGGCISRNNVQEEAIRAPIIHKQNLIDENPFNAPQNFDQNIEENEPLESQLQTLISKNSMKDVQEFLHKNQIDMGKLDKNKDFILAPFNRISINPIDYERWIKFLFSMGAKVPDTRDFKNKKNNTYKFFKKLRNVEQKPKSVKKNLVKKFNNPASEITSLDLMIGLRLIKDLNIKDNDSFVFSILRNSILLNEELLALDILHNHKFDSVILQVFLATSNPAQAIKNRLNELLPQKKPAPQVIQPKKEISNKLILKKPASNIIFEKYPRSIEEIEKDILETAARWEKDDEEFDKEMAALLEEE